MSTRLGKRQIIGYSPEISTTFPLLHANCLKEENSASHIYIKGGNLPVTSVRLPPV